MPKGAGGRNRLCGRAFAGIRKFLSFSGFDDREIFLFAAAGLTATEQRLETSEQIELHYLQMEELKEIVVKGDFKHGAGLAAMIYKFMTDER
ncbi:hypothetical protein JOC76_005967 [Neobacillus cucumis]|nr:hypothetical protein [Neobacillus cucumis]